MEDEITTSESDIAISSESELCDESSDENVHAKEAEVNDWVLVAFRHKKSVRRFVGLIQEKHIDGWLVKFARRVGANKFKWLVNDDISVVDNEQIERVLSLPKFHRKDDRVICFIFSEGFKRLNVE